MFSLYKKELQSYFLSPIAYFVIAFFMATFSLTFIQEIGNVSSSTYTFSFSSIFYVNIFYFIFLLPLLTMRNEQCKRFDAVKRSVKAVAPYLRNDFHIGGDRK